MNNYNSRRWDRDRPIFLKLGFSIAIGFVLIVFNYTSYGSVENNHDYDVGPEIDLIVTPPVTAHIKKKKIPPVKEVKKFSLNDKIILKKEEFVEDKDLFEVKPDESEDGVEDTILVDDTPPILLPIIEEATEDDSPLVFADRMPVYGDCKMETEEQRRACTESNMLKHIYANLKYPQVARENEIEGLVVASFIVDKEGNIHTIEIVRDIGAGCGAAVKRTIKNMDNFIPGKQNGRPVSVIYRLPVKFKLQ